jgi:hypothetical protein
MRIRGSLQEWEICQWSNDWITADCEAARAQNRVLSPLKVTLDVDEVLRMLEDFAKPPPRSSGEFWTLWNLDARTGVFTKRVGPPR